MTIHTCRNGLILVVTVYHVKMTSLVNTPNLKKVYLSAMNKLQVIRRSWDSVVSKWNRNMCVRHLKHCIKCDLKLDLLNVEISILINRNLGLILLGNEVGSLKII